MLPSDEGNMISELSRVKAVLSKPVLLIHVYTLITYY